MASAAVLKNRKIAIFWPRFERFWPHLESRRTSTSWAVRPLKIWNFANPSWRRPPSWKNRKIAIFWPRFDRFDEIWHSDTVSPPWAFRPLKFQKFKNPRWLRLPSWKSKNRRISVSRPRSDCFRRNLTRWCSFALALMQTEIPLMSEKSNLKGK